MELLLKDLTTPERQNWLQHAIGPRPICFASTMDKDGNINLSPFSFFNMFSTQPPIVVFSPSRRVRDKSNKHTLENVLQVPEVVINIVDNEMVEQASLSSCEYPRGVNEFEKSGFTMQPSEMIKPPRVRESKVQMECRVIEVKPLGEEGGAGNLVICEVILMHIDDSILNDDKSMIDQKKLHHVARLGGHWYCRVNESNLFIVEKPNMQLGIGLDALPDAVRNSRILTGNQLAKLANVHEMPLYNPGHYDINLKNIIQYFSATPDDMETELHRYAADLLNHDKVQEAWQALLVGS